MDLVRIGSVSQNKIMYYESSNSFLFSLQFCNIYGNGLSQYRKCTGYLLSIFNNCHNMFVSLQNIFYALNNFHKFSSFKIPCV